MKLLLEISYLGCAFHGYQVQPGKRTVQGVLQAALEKFYGAPLKLTGCSRTDAGVHALQYFLTVEGEGELIRSMPPDRLPFAIAPLLAPDITVISAQALPYDNFHARYDVKFKEYEYLIWNAPHMSPFYRGRAWHYPRPLDCEIMCEGGRPLTGRHDFRAFMAEGSPVKSTVRELFALDCRREKRDSGEVVIIRARGDGFLYNMVRILAGTLVNVSEGKIKVSALSGILESGERQRAGMTLPPDGLYLSRVVYK